MNPDSTHPCGSSVSPGFPPLFAVLSVDTRKAALQYISHSDETERRARIMRVEQSILEGSEDHNPKMPKITHDLNKGKGHVFDFADHQQQDAILSRNERSGTKSSPVCGKELEDEASDSGGVEVSSNFPVLSSTVFRIGASSVAHLAGTQSEGKKSRKRPNKWRRMAHAKSVELASKDVGSAELCATDSEVACMAVVRNEDDSENHPKRKVVGNVGDHSAKSQKHFLDTVASDLKPLPPQ